MAFEVDSETICLKTSVLAVSGYSCGGEQTADGSFHLKTSRTAEGLDSVVKKNCLTDPLVFLGST